MTRSLKPEPHSLSPRILWVASAFLIIFIGLYVVLPAVGKFGHTYVLLVHARPGYILLALLATAATYAVAAKTYVFLALRPISYGRTLLMQIASSFANRVFPAGTGGLALNLQYLRKARHTTTQAAVVVAVNNGLGFLANIFLLVVFLLLQPTKIHFVLNPDTVHHLVLYIPVGVVLIMGVLAVLHRRIHLAQWVRPVTGSFSMYRRNPSRLALAFCSSALVSLLYALVLYAAAHSLAVDLSFTQALIGMTLATVGTVLIPTPGGIGGAEAGIVSALVALQVGTPLSLAVALLYRVFTFWLPLVAGAIALRVGVKYL